jgi:hypothetical protein
MRVLGERPSACSIASSKPFLISSNSVPIYFP